MTNLVKSCWVIWITVYLRNETCQDFQFCIVCTDVNVEVFHVVKRALPPILRVICHVISTTDNRWLAVL